MIKSTDSGWTAIAAMRRANWSSTRKELRGRNVSAPNARNRIRLTIMTAGMSTTASAMTGACGVPNPFGHMKTVEASTPAAPGLGIPTQYRLSGF